MINAISFQQFRASLTIWYQYAGLQGVKFKFPYEQHMHWPIMATFGQYCLSLFPATNISVFTLLTKIKPCNLTF